MIKKPFIVLIAMLMVIASSIQFLNYRYYMGKKEQYIQNRVKDVQKHYDVTYQTFKTNSTHFYESIVKNNKMMNILKDSNSKNRSIKNKARKKLVNIFNTKYQLISKLGIDLIQFHLPNNESFFRRHIPDKFGENLTSTRYSVAQTNNTKKPYEGLEIGKYTHAIRFVFPLFDETNKHLGSMEGSVSSSAFIEYMERALQKHMHFVIHSDAINPNNKELLSKYTKTNGLQNCLRLKNVAKPDFKHTEEEKRQIREKLKNFDISTTKPFVISVQKNDIEEIVVFLPIQNIQDNKTIAYLIVFDDDNDLLAIRNDYIKQSIIGFLISLLLTFLIFKIIRSKYNLEIEVENKTKELKDLNDNLEKKVKDKTQQLENSLNIISKYVIFSRTDLKGNIIEVSDAFCEVSQFTREELIGTPHNIIRHPDSSGTTFEDMWNTIKKGKVWSGEVKNKKKNDGYYWVYVDVSPEFNEQGDIASYIAIRHDITAKKDFEQQHKQLLRSEKLASMGEMIGNIAHQWRQPLSTISTAATGMEIQKQFDMLTDEYFFKSCKLINTNAQYLSKTIDDFKRFIEGKRTKKIFNLNDTIDSLMHLLEGTIKNNNITMVFNLQENININGYENELTQCMINIFNNAKDILVEKNIEDKLIFITTLEDEENRKIIIIKDNGGGIPQDILPRIFEPYFTTKHKSQGTGLGLHMTYNLIVDGMGGTIEASNVEYQYNDKSYTGAEFKITLHPKQM